MKLVWKQIESNMPQHVEYHVTTIYGIRVLLMHVKMNKRWNFNLKHEDTCKDVSIKSIAYKSRSACVRSLRKYLRMIVNGNGVFF